jgi:hypothetical protein
LRIRLYILFVYCLILQQYGTSQLYNKPDSAFKNEQALVPVDKMKPLSATIKGINLKALQPDSIPKAAFRLVTNTGLSSFKQFKNSLVDSLRPFKSILGELKEAYKNPVKLNRAEAEYTGMFDSSYLYNNTAAYLGNFNLSSDWTIANIPATINILNQSWSDINNNYNRVSVKFDKENYLNSIKKKLSGKFDPASLLQLPADAAQKMVEQAKNIFNSELSSLNDKYGGMLTNELSAFTGIKNLSTIDINSLRQKFLNPDFIKQVLGKQNLLATLQEKINSGEKINQQDFITLQNEVVKLKAVQDLIGKVEEHKSKWESSGLLKKIKESELLRKDKIMQLVNDPSSIRKMAKQHLSLKGLQRMFLNINRLDVGQNALSLSPVSFRSFLSNGAVTEFLNKGKSILLMVGKYKDFNSILDYNFSANLFSGNGIAKAARIELGKSKISSSHLSVSSFNQSLLNSIIPSNAADFRKILVTTVSNQFLLGQKGQVSFDLSRSASQYQHPVNATDSTLPNKNTLSGILSGDNLFANTAIAIKYSDEFPLNGLSYQFSFNKVANGYSNPGNSFLSNGSTELGLNFRKTFLKNKIQVSVRANGREYKFSENDNRKWRSIYLTLDARWKMKKGQYMALRYQPTRMVRIEDLSKQVVTSIERLSFDANLYKRFNKTSYRNLVTLSYQSSSYAFIQSASKTSSFLLNSFQNISIGKNLLYVNSTYNKASNQSGFVYLNTSFLTEAGYTYQLFRKLSASSGVTYNSITGWFRQLGVRQTLSGQLGEKFSVNIYIDARKNLAVYQSLWNQPIRADIALRYSFGNNE